MNNIYPAYLETITPLGASGIFTSTARDARNQPSVALPIVSVGSAWQTPFRTFNVSLVADQASVANGIVVQGSYNGTTWNAVVINALALGVPLNISVPITYPLYRVVCTNGLVAQGSVIITTSFI